MYPWKGRKGTRQGTSYKTPSSIRYCYCFKHEKEIQETPYPKVSAIFVFLLVVLHQLVQRHVVPQQGKCGAPSLHSHPSAPHADRGVSAHQEGRKGRWPPAGTCLRTVPRTPETCSLWEAWKQGREGLAVGSNSFLLYKTHQNFISMRNPSVKQCISFLSGRTAKYLDLWLTSHMQSPPALHARTLWQQAQSTPLGLAGPKRQPHARHCPVGQAQVPWKSSRLWTVYKNYHMDLPLKENQQNKRRWSKQRKIITDLRAVGALWPNQEKASCCQ